MSSSRDESDTTANDGKRPPENENNYPKGLRLYLIILGLFLEALCFGLDRTIISTAIPKITTEFNSLPDIGWYGSAYMLTSCCFQLFFGKLYAELNAKWLFLAALGFFEVGSIICAAAPNSATLIVGRAIAGIGAAGTTTGVFVILAHSVPLHNRPRATGAVGGAIGIAQIVAPTLGGALTDYATWRWCFWINLPLGAVTLATVVLFVNLPSTVTRQPMGKSPLEIAKRFDLAGNALLIPSIVSLLLALQWGGIEHAWNSWRIILTLTVFAVSIVAWGAIQYLAGEDATVPLRMARNRSMPSAMWYMFCVMGVCLVLVQFVPVWFQSTKGISAYQSGVDLLALTISMSIAVVASGFITSKIGYYVPLMIVGTIITSIAAGLITRYDLNTTTGYWMGTLILVGFGIGIGAQAPLMIPQTMFSGPDVSLGTSIVIFAQTMSGTIWISVANNIFLDNLVAELDERAPDVDPRVVITAGASGVAESLGKIYPDAIGEILGAYSAALGKLWIIPAVLACLGVISCAFVEWKSVKGEQGKRTNVEAADGKVEKP